LEKFNNNNKQNSRNWIFKKKINSYDVSIKDLNHQYLKVRRNNQKIKYIKDIPITSAFSKLLLHLLETNKIDSNEYNKITDTERDIFELLISGDITINKLSHVRYNKNEIDELINRFNILKGELLIGNNNPDLLKELKITILRLVNYNILSMKEIIPLLEQIFYLI
jgi:hypothetical protein